MANTYKRLGALRPANTNEAKLYGPATATSAVVNLIICNQDTVENSYRIAITNTDATADGEDWMVYDVIMAPNGTHTFSGISLNYPETIRVQAGVANKISFIAHGLEIS